MDFDDSFFEDESKDGDDKQSSSRQGQVKTSTTNNTYTAKICYPEWFNDITRTEEVHMILKYRGDLCYRRQQLQEATQFYHQAIEVLPASNTSVCREMLDSLTRCHLRMSQFSEALHYSEQLVAYFHDNDASSWQLMAACYKGLGQIRDYLLSLQKCNLLQRYNTSTWLELAEAYTELGIHHAMMSEAMAAKNSNTASKFSNSRDVSSQSSGKGVHDCVDDKNSKVGTENDVMESIFSNTVTLFRPYFKWQTENIDCKNFDPSLVTVVALLGRCVSVDNFLQDVQQLPWERNKQMLKLLFQVSSCCCLIWARQLQLYSVRHSTSFVTQTHTDKLHLIETLIDGYHDDLIHYLTECFNHPTIFDESAS